MKCDGPPTSPDRRWRDLPVVSYDEARHKIENGYALFYVSRLSWWSPLSWVKNLLSLAIRLTSGGTEITHVAMAGWWGDNLMRVQMHWDRDRIRRLSDEVREYRGTIIVARPIYKWAGAVCGSPRAVNRMVQVCQREYGWRNLLRCAIYRHTSYKWLMRHSKMYSTIVGRILPPPGDCDDHTLPPFCSGAYSMVWRSLKYDLCPDLEDNETRPDDLFLSALMEPLFVLAPS